MKLCRVYEDKQFSDAIVSEGKLFVFVGYDNGNSTGNIVTRYKDSEGNFGIFKGDKNSLQVVVSESQPQNPVDGMIWVKRI